MDKLSTFSIVLGTKSSSIFNYSYVLSTCVCFTNLERCLPLPISKICCWARPFYNYAFQRTNYLPLFAVLYHLIYHGKSNPKMYIVSVYVCLLTIMLLDPLLQPPLLMTEIKSLHPLNCLLGLVHTHFPFAIYVDLFLKSFLHQQQLDNRV